MRHVHPYGPIIIAAVVAAIGLIAVPYAVALPPRPDHVVIVIEENQSYEDILASNSPALYIRSLAASSASFTDSHAITRPSQPNYLDLFSGDDQGTDGTDDYPSHTPFTTPNFGAQLRAAGSSFTGYSQGLPHAGALDESYSYSGQNEYVHKHNPWANWQASSPTGNQLPPSTNQPLTAFPGNFNLLPTVSFVVPDEQNDMHDGPIAQGDAWLRANLNRYYEWAQFHNSLLVVTFDEDDFTVANHITTIFAGPMIKPGGYSQHINHFNMLRTLEDMYGLSHIAGAASVSTITGAFYNSPRLWTAGDANFDGTVNMIDFVALGSHFNGANPSWTTGDFNADGITNALDFNILASHYGQSSLVPTEASSLVVPEPASVVAMSIPLMMRLRRRIEQ